MSNFEFVSRCVSLHLSCCWSWQASWRRITWFFCQRPSHSWLSSWRVRALRQYLIELAHVILKVKRCLCYCFELRFKNTSVCHFHVSLTDKNIPEFSCSSSLFCRWMWGSWAPSAEGHSWNGECPRWITAELLLIPQRLSHHRRRFLHPLKCAFIIHTYIIFTDELFCENTRSQFYNTPYLWLSAWPVLPLCSCICKCKKPQSLDATCIF